jgi:SAM-dependent methyltransferase
MSAPVKSIEDLWGYLKRLRFVREAIASNFRGGEHSKISILDVGCGNGSQLAIQLALDGFQVTGIDVDERSIEQARRLAKEIGNINFHRGQVEEIEALGEFDVVILSEVLEHTDDPRSLLAASVKHLHDEGIAIITVPNGYGEFEIDSWVYRALGLDHVVQYLSRSKEKALAGTENLDNGHVQFFTRKRLRTIFAECGLEVFKEGAASFWSGPMIGHSLGRSTRFVEWNARVTDRLPFSLASGWYFALKRIESSE